MFFSTILYMFGCTLCIFLSMLVCTFVLFLSMFGCTPFYVACMGSTLCLRSYNDDFGMLIPCFSLVKLYMLGFLILALYVCYDMFSIYPCM